MFNGTPTALMLQNGVTLMIMLVLYSQKRTIGLPSLLAMFFYTVATVLEYTFHLPAQVLTWIFWVLMASLAVDGVRMILRRGGLRRGGI